MELELKSLSFCLFVLITVTAYFCAHRFRRVQRDIIIAASCVMIISLSSVGTLLISVTAASAVFFMGRLIERKLENGKTLAGKLLMYAGVALVVAYLCYYKFFTSTYADIWYFFDGLGIQFGELIVPLGISYYSLSLIAYILDVGHKKHPAEKNWLDFMEFILYFPSIIEGPINLYKKIMPQLKEAHSFNEGRVVSGLMRILWGYIKKIVIADRIGIIVSEILADEETCGLVVFYAMILYSFQIYTDFSGGIDVMMGVSAILGISLAENFRAPLVAGSVTEYWQRWHMSLGEFMEKYIYYPIVLNRTVMKLSRKIPIRYLQRAFSATAASVVVFVIVGIWHGTGWNYVVYGCYQALFVGSAVLLGPVWKSVRTRLMIRETAVSYRILTALRTFVILTFGRYFIKAADLEHTFALFARTFRSFNISALFDGTLLQYGLDYKNLYLMIFCIFLVLFVDILAEKKISISKWILKQDVVFRYAAYLAGLFFIIIFGIYGSEYDSSAFIYQAF